MTEYPRFKEWADQYYPQEKYFSAEDRLADIELRMREDGRAMPEVLRQSLLEDFQSYYEPAIRAAQERQADLQQAADMLGSGKIPRGMSEDIIEGMEKKEVMGVDLENIIPPKPQPTTIRDILQGGFGFVYGGISSTISKAKEQFGRWFKKKQR